MGGYVWTPEDVRSLRRMVEDEQLRPAEVAKRLSRGKVVRTPAAVCCKASELGLKFQPKRAPSILRSKRSTWQVTLPVAELLRLYRAGARMSDIAAHYGCSETLIRNWLYELDEPRRPRGRPKGRPQNIPWPRAEYRAP